MVLVDTSVWIDHLRRGCRGLEALLLDDHVVGHPFVTGELACGRLANRDEVLGLLLELPQAPTISQEEFLFFVEREALAGTGVGLVDVHLLASARLAGIRLWSFDRRLQRSAARMGIAHAASTGRI